MTNRLDQLFHFQQSALDLRTFRQQLLASNIANADTPNFKARDIDFSTALRRALDGSGSGLVLASTSPRDLAGSSATEPARVLYSSALEPSLDGNTVDMDVQRGRFAENSVHYETDIAVLNQKIKLMTSAIKG